jgi:hypothetical protein
VAALRTRPRPQDGADGAEVGPRGLFKYRQALLILLVAAGVALVWLGPFVADPRRLAPGPDMAWYTWRAEMLTSHQPGELVLADGPLAVFGGGYRVTTPLLGALLRQVGDLDRYTLATMLVAGRQVLLVLALAAVGHRLRRSPLVFGSVAVVSAAALYLRPFVGYVDNLFALLFGAAALWFLPDARNRWPARVAIFLFTFLMVFTHPTTAAIFIAVLFGAVALRALLRRSVRDAIRSEGWILGAAVCGGAAGYLSWLFGLWGPGRTFRDAIHIPPYPSEAFLDATFEQVKAVHVLQFVPLVLLGLAVITFLNRRRFLVDPISRAVVAWLLPLAGMLGFYVGLRYPYKRFLNSTVAPWLLAGLGLWAAVGFSIRLARHGMGERRWWKPAAGATGVVLTGALLLSAWVSGIRSYENQDPWAPRNLRVGFAAVRGYLQVDKVRRPLVFVISVGPKQNDSLVWGGIWRGNWSQIRAGLPSRAIPETYVYFGAVREFVAERPTRTGNRLVDLISRATHAEIQEQVAGRKPLVLLVKRFNRRLGNDRYLRPPRSVPMGGGVFVLMGRQFAQPDPVALGSARRASRERSEFLAGPVDRSAHPGHLLRVGVGLAFLLLLPGLLAARWFGVSNAASAVGMVPALSLAMNIASGLLVLAVLRRPLSAELAWVVAGLATLVGAVLQVISVWRQDSVPATVQQDSRDGQASDGQSRSK